MLLLGPNGQPAAGWPQDLPSHAQVSWLAPSGPARARASRPVQREEQAGAGDGRVTEGKVRRAVGPEGRRRGRAGNADRPTGSRLPARVKRGELGAGDGVGVTVGGRGGLVAPGVFGANAAMVPPTKNVPSDPLAIAETRPAKGSWTGQPGTSRPDASSRKARPGSPATPPAMSLPARYTLPSGPRTASPDEPIGSVTGQPSGAGVTSGPAGGARSSTSKYSVPDS